MKANVVFPLVKIGLLLIAGLLYAIARGAAQ